MHLRSSWRRRVEVRSWGCGSKGEADVKGPGSHFEWTLVHPSVSGSGSAEHLCGSHVLGPGILR